ncbi:MAG: DUF4058 family protein [Fimbriiglobus sp.]
MISPAPLAKTPEELPMPSPFPGMDPWLESEEIFPNLHDTLLMGIRNSLNLTLPEPYVATLKNRVWIDDVQRRDPDISVLNQRLWRPRDEGTSAVATMPGLQSLGAYVPQDTWEEPYLEIVSTEGKRLVTAIEILSPSNKKPGENGHAAYLMKQKEFVLGRVNIVEIDLLRRGTHASMIPRDRLAQLSNRAFAYSISVTCWGNPSDDQFFGVTVALADQLPTFGIPLDPGIEPPTIPLQTIFSQAYDQARFDKLVRYTEPPQPKLSPEDVAWANERLRAAGIIA